MSDELESWKNATPSRVVLKKYTQRGELGDEMVTGGKVFHISPKERRINQEMAASPDLDMFQNGYLTPVRLIETEEDAKEIASNPNLMSETEMADLFKGHWKTFESRIGEVSNVNTLNRLLEVASTVDAKVRQVDVIKARIEEVNPQDHVEISQAATTDPMTGLRVSNTR